MIRALIILLLPCYIIAAEVESNEIQPLWIILNQIQSPSETIEATVYISTEEKQPNLWRQDTYLEIASPSGGWRIDPNSISEMIDVLEFIDDEHLMIEMLSITRSHTVILNLDNREIRNIGGGRGEYIREGDDQGLIMLRGQKGYYDGAYWYSVIVDLDGSVVEVQSDVETNCMTIGEILNLETKPATLRQSLDECIGVVR